MWGFAGLSAGSSPVPNHPRYHRLLRSPHERLGGRAVHPTRFPSHVSPLCPSLDFHQSHGQALVVGLVPTQVAIPCEQSLVDARGEGDLQHLPRLRFFHLPSVTIYYHNPGHMSTPFLNFLKKILRVGAGRPAHFTTLKRKSKNLFEKIQKKGLTALPVDAIIKMFQEGTERKETP